jgi:hypothetical protein
VHAWQPFAATPCLQRGFIRPVVGLAYPSLHLLFTSSASLKCEALLHLSPFTIHPDSGRLQDTVHHATCPVRLRPRAKLSYPLDTQRHSLELGHPSEYVESRVRNGYFGSLRAFPRIPNNPNHIHFPGVWPFAFHPALQSLASANSSTQAVQSPRTAAADECTINPSCSLGLPAPAGSSART